VRRITLLLVSMALTVCVGAWVAWAAVIQCSANQDCFGTNQADTLTGTSGAARIFGVGGAVLAQNQHYRQLHYLKLGRYDAEELS
jgi:hypothetical protein